MVSKKQAIEISAGAAAAITLVYFAVSQNVSGQYAELLKMVAIFGSATAIGYFGMTKKR